MEKKLMPKGEFWSTLTPEQRSVEMKRRQSVARKAREAEYKREYRARKSTVPSTESPFPKESLMNMVSLSSGTIKQRLEALEAALAALKAEIGL
jgi:hypothetical protein